MMPFLAAPYFLQALSCVSFAGGRGVAAFRGLGQCFRLGFLLRSWVPPVGWWRRGRIEPFSEVSKNLDYSSRRGVEGSMQHASGSHGQEAIAVSSTPSPFTWNAR